MLEEFKEMHKKVQALKMLLAEYPSTALQVARELEAILDDVTPWVEDMVDWCDQYR